MLWMRRFTYFGSVQRRYYTFQRSTKLCSTDYDIGNHDIDYSILYKGEGEAELPVLFKTGIGSYTTFRSVECKIRQNCGSRSDPLFHVQPSSLVDFFSCADLWISLSYIHIGSHPAPTSKALLPHYFLRNTQLSYNKMEPDASLPIDI